MLTVILWLLLGLVIYVAALKLNGDSLKQGAKELLHGRSPADVLYVLLLRCGSMPLIVALLLLALACAILSYLSKYLSEAVERVAEVLADGIAKMCFFEFRME